MLRQFEEAKLHSAYLSLATSGPAMHVEENLPRLQFFFFSQWVTSCFIQASGQTEVVCGKVVHSSCPQYYQLVFLVLYHFTTQRKKVTLIDHFFYVGYDALDLKGYLSPAST